MNSIGPDCEKSQNNTHNWSSSSRSSVQPSRTIISLSLKRKHNVGKVAKVEENLDTKPIFKKRLLSLKRKNSTPKAEVNEVTEIKNNLKSQEDTDSLLEKKVDLENEVLSTKVETSADKISSLVSDQENAFMMNSVTYNTDYDEKNVFKTDINCNRVCKTGILQSFSNSNINGLSEENDDCVVVQDKMSLISVSSVTDESLDTIIYEKPSYTVNFAVTNCKNVNVSTKNSSIKRLSVSQVKNNTNIDCELVGSSQESDANKLTSLSPTDQTVSVNLEVKKNNLSTSEDQSKVLILNTNAIEKLSHVIVQPPSYKSFRRKIQGARKISSGNRRKSVIRSARKNGSVSGDSAKLNQIRIDTVFKKIKDLNGVVPVSKEKIRSKLDDNVRNCDNEVLGHDDMSRIARADTARSDGVGRLSRRVSKEENVLSRSTKMSPNPQIRASNSEAPQLPSPRCKNESSSSCSPRRRNIDSLHFNLPSKTKSSKTAVVPRDIPHYKIVAGTHFAVDAFCYGDIPGVKNYFLTHFHSDHYSGLKKSFNKTLFCTQITADLCISRLGVNQKHIHVINVDESLRVDGVEVTAIEANHCPGAVMLLFTLPNGKTLLHTGDFRATPAMESHPAFWNTDIHTIYLDTTYCNPRYDFPTQDQSLEMALHILRQKKMALEKVGKKFTSVLIVCGTYTIGKEKFFLGLARRVGCAVWACPEKDKVLQTVEKRSFSSASPQSCQLHVVPMRDLTHEKLRSYLDSLQGPFTEVVAFKPSGWENGKNTPATKDMVTVHGIPYSEHSSFSEMIRFVNFLKPKQVVPTVDISGGVKAVQKYFPCPLVYKEDLQCQTKLTDFFSVQNRQQISAVS